MTLAWPWPIYGKVEFLPQGFGMEKAETVHFADAFMLFDMEIVSDLTLLKF